MPIIKKSKDHNQYVLTDDKLWIRDLTKHVNSLDINNLISENEYSFLAENESQNMRIRLAPIDSEKFSIPKAVIVSDGYNFSENVKNLFSLPRSVSIIGVNAVLNKWPAGLRMDYYIANNPYIECMSFLPFSVQVPKVIVSNRTYPPFVRHIVNRKVVTYKYSPTPNKRFGRRQSSYTVDDYRNPICAAVYLSYKFGITKLALLGCDESFKGQRPGSVLLENGLHTYPQNITSSRIVDGLLFWLKKQEINIVDLSNGYKLQNAAYITFDKLTEWFNL